jgi:hypothetical protein
MVFRPGLLELAIQASDEMRMLVVNEAQEVRGASGARQTPLLEPDSDSLVATVPLVTDRVLGPVVGCQTSFEADEIRDAFDEAAVALTLGVVLQRVDEFVAEYTYESVS